MTYVFIISTFGSARAQQFDRLIDSIEEQSSPHWKILIIHVMQGKECRYFNKGCSIQSSNVQYIVACDPGIGLSRGRNICLDILETTNTNLDDCTLFFSDDDCFYPSDFIETFREIQSGNDHLSVAGLVMDESGSYALSYSSERGEHFVTARQVFRNISSINFGVPYSDLRFDENLGAGTNHFSCEEFDYVFRRLSGGLVIRYNSDLMVFHPDLKTLSYKVFLRKVFNNSIGHGAYFRKHLSAVSFYYIFVNPFLSVIKRLFLLDYKNAIGSFVGFFGRVFGFFVYSRKSVIKCQY